MFNAPQSRTDANNKLEKQLIVLFTQTHPHSYQWPGDLWACRWSVVCRAAMFALWPPKTGNERSTLFLALLLSDMLHNIFIF